jgi:hypothetical protein
MKAEKLNNPFVVAGYSASEYFCDREKEMDKIISVLNRVYVN